eukprot:3109224-Amphidinium_carterae.1
MDRKLGTYTAFVMFNIDLFTCSAATGPSPSHQEANAPGAYSRCACCIRHLTRIANLTKTQLGRASLAEAISGVLPSAFKMSKQTDCRRIVCNMSSLCLVWQCDDAILMM